MNKKLLVLVFLFFFVFSLEIFSQEEIETDPDKIPKEYKVIITGRLLYKDGSPAVKADVMLSEAVLEGEKLKTILKVGKKGIVLNPSALTDSSGNFKIIADRRFWKESGKFTLEFGNYSLRDSNGNLIVITVNEKAEKVELGDIIAIYRYN